MYFIFKSKMLIFIVLFNFSYNRMEVLPDGDRRAILLNIDDVVFCKYAISIVVECYLSSSTIQ